MCQMFTVELLKCFQTVHDRTDWRNWVHCTVLEELDGYTAFYYEAYDASILKEVSVMGTLLSVPCHAVSSHNPRSTQEQHFKKLSSKLVC